MKRTIGKIVMSMFGMACLMTAPASSDTIYVGSNGGDFDNDWDNGNPSSTNPGTVNVSGSNLVRATANFGGGWTIDHTAGDLDFSGGGWNVNGGGVGGTYNLSGGSISVSGTGTQDRGNFLVNGIDFNLSGGAVSSELTFGLANAGAMNFLAGSGTLSSAAFKANPVGTMTFVSGWTGSATIDTLDAAAWQTLLVTTLAGSTLNASPITAASFDPGAGNFLVIGNTLSISAIPEPSSLALLGMGAVFIWSVRKRKVLA